MKKRALGIILSVLCVLLLFSACGGKDKKEKKKSDEAKVKVEKEESEEKEDEEEEVKLSPEEGTECIDVSRSEYDGSYSWNGSGRGNEDCCR